LDIFILNAKTFFYFIANLESYTQRKKNMLQNSVENENTKNFFYFIANLELDVNRQKRLNAAKFF
jgi:hypothetical protein